MIGASSGTTLQPLISGDSEGELQRFAEQVEEFHCAAAVQTWERPVDSAARYPDGIRLVAACEPHDSGLLVELADPPVDLGRPGPEC